MYTALIVQAVSEYDQKPVTPVPSRVSYTDVDQ